MSSDPPGFELPLRLLLGFRVLIDDLHAELARLGHLQRGVDPRDSRRKIVQLTERGTDCLHRSARIFDKLRAHWASTLGPQRLQALEADLRKMTPDAFRLDVPGWFGSS